MRIRIPWLRINVTITIRMPADRKEVQAAFEHGLEYSSVRRLTSPEWAPRPAEPYEAHNRGIA